MRNRLVLIIAVVLVVVALPVGWWLFSPLLLNREVDEAFPVAGDVAAAEVAAEVGESTALAEAAPVENSADEVRAIQRAADITDTAADDPLPTVEADEGTAAETNEEAEWSVVAQATFQDADASHRGSGTATILQQGEQRVLRFEEFEVTNGPDLHVLLVENIAGTSSNELGEYVDLGSLKGNLGSQNYDLPADLDLDQFSGVVIYCQPFHVVFATAPF